MPAPTLPLLPEILSLICESLASHKSTLTSLARTCTVFKRPALEVLWFDLEGFYPLVKCLPSSLWTEEVGEHGEHVVLKSPILSTDCLQLFHYASLIRHFSNYSTSNNTLQVHTSMYSGLQVALQGEKLLPNVKKLEWNCTTLTFPYIHMFLGPRITKVQYTFSTTSPEQLSLVPALINQFPSLEGVGFSFYYGTSKESDWKAVQLISGSVYMCNNLKVLEVPSLTHSALLQVSLLPYLESLTMTEECKFGDVKHVTNTGGFPALINLQLLGCHNASDCIAVLKLMDCSPVGKLALHIDEVDTSESWEKLFITMNQHCRHNSLKYLECWDGVEGHSETIVTRLLGEMVDSKGTTLFQF
ncbi:hypothetical protein BDQ17DRAFT_1095408 [Cyathus striatus]|nr:hypothetical protein BDQ17DRAFT_1095408 [Cyathus striatus]